MELMRGNRSPGSVGDDKLELPHHGPISGRG